MSSYRILNKRIFLLIASSLLVIASSTLLINKATHAASALALDKLVTKNQTSAATSVTTAAFSTAQPGELLVAFVATDGPSTANGQTVTGLTTTGLTWSLRQRVNTQFGTSEIWQAVAPNVLTNVTVKANLSSSKVSALTVAAFTGADTSVNGAVGAANAATGAPSVNLTATRNGSWMWGVGNDWDGNTARTVGSGQTKISEYLATVGDTMWVQNRTTANGTAGAISTLNDTAPTNHRWNFAAIEILPAVTDTAAPSVPAGLSATATAPTNVNLSWTASTDDTGITGYKIFRDGTQIGTSATASFTDATTVASTSYSYTVRAYDAASNTSADSTVATVTTPTPDTTAPVITSAAAGSLTQTSATITWTTNETADTQVAYGLTASYGSTSTYVATLLTNHSVSLSGLTPNTTYHYQAKSKDGSGNLATSADATFTTLAPAPDTTPPTTAVTSPSNGGSVTGTVNVTASASDNVGVIGVQFKLDGNNLSTEDTTSPYSVSWNTTAASNGSHLITSVARDAAGNTTTSSVVTITVSNGGGGGTAFTVDGSQTFQTIDGLGAAINVHSWDNGNLRPALDMLVDGNGTKVFRVVYDMTDWETTNDNADANSYNWAYYDPIYNSTKITDLWNTIDYLHQKGIPDSQIVLSFMGIGPTWMGTLSSDGTSEKYTLSAGQENEWAEMIASLAYYGYSHGHTFGAISPDNELDWSYHEGIVMSPSQFSVAMDKLDQKLNAFPGMTGVRFLGPDSVSADPVNYMNAINNYPNVMSRFDHFSGHNYGAAYSTGVNNAASFGKNLWISEFSEFDYAIDHLKSGAGSILMWDAYDSVYEHAKLNGLGDQPGNDNGPAAPWLAYNTTSKTYTPRDNFYQFGQLSKWVVPGMVRIGANQTASGVKTIAFYDPVSKRVTVVGQNTSASNVTFNGTLAGLPAVPSLEQYTTTSTVKMQRGSDVSVTGNAFTVVAPAKGIVTLTYMPPADQVPPTAPTSLAATGGIGAAGLSWASATDNIGVTAYNVYRSTTPGFTPSAATKVGQTSSTSYSDVTAPGTYYYQVTAQDAAGNVGPASNETLATTTADTTPPTAPASLTAPTVGGQSVGLSWTAATDDVSVTSYKVYRNGAALGTSATTSFTDTTVAPSTAYTYTVTALDGAANESPQSNPVTITTTIITLGVEAQVVIHQSSAASSITSPAFNTTTDGDLLVAFLSSDGPSGGGSQSFSAVNTTGLTWTLRKRTNSQAGTAEIWTAVAPTTLTNATVTATRSGLYVGSMVITAFKGANTTTIGAVGGAAAGTGAPSASLVTTAAGSLIWGVGNDWDGATTVTPAAGQTKVDEFQASVGDTFWVQRATTASTTAGQTVTINDTAPTNHRWNLALIEILPR